MCLCCFVCAFLPGAPKWYGNKCCTQGRYSQVTAYGRGLSDGTSREVQDSLHVPTFEAMLVLVPAFTKHKHSHSKDFSPSPYDLSMLTQSSGWQIRGSSVDFEHEFLNTTEPFI